MLAVFCRQGWPGTGLEVSVQVLRAQKITPASTVHPGSGMDNDVFVNSSSLIKSIDTIPYLFEFPQFKLKSSFAFCEQRFGGKTRFVVAMIISS